MVSWVPVCMTENDTIKSVLCLDTKQIFMFRKKHMNLCCRSFFIQLYLDFLKTYFYFSLMYLIFFIKHLLKNQQTQVITLWFCWFNVNIYRKPVIFLNTNPYLFEKYNLTFTCKHLQNLKYLCSPLYCIFICFLNWLPFKFAL